MSSIDTLKRHIAGQFFLRAIQPWVKGYHDAHVNWLADSSLQVLSDQVTLHWAMRTDHHTDCTSGVPRAILAVQCLTIAIRKSKQDSRNWLQLLADAGPPDMTAIRNKQTPQRTAAEEAWYWISVGLNATGNHRLIGSWKSMTPAFREMLHSALPLNRIPMPDQLNTPEAIAWLEQCVHTYKHPVDTDVLKAFRDSTDDHTQALAKLLIDQHAAWKQADVFSSYGNDLFGYFVPSRLAELACFHAPLSEALVQRAQQIGLTYPPSITLRPGEDLIEKCARMEQTGIKPRYFAAGYALNEHPVRPATAQPVIISGTTFLKLPLRPPLLVVLDIDLTSEEVAFLGIKGKRLRICSPANSFNEPFFTRVDLKGGVRPISPFQRFPKPDGDDDLGDSVYTLGRPLISPYEGLQNAGGCLGQPERFGGAPNWEQYPADPVSPASGETMTFLAQFNHTYGGTLYAFLDIDNLIAAVIVQWD